MATTTQRLTSEHPENTFHPYNTLLSAAAATPSPPLPVSPFRDEETVAQKLCDFCTEVTGWDSSPICARSQSLDVGHATYPLVPLAHEILEGHVYLSSTFVSPISVQ